MGKDINDLEAKQKSNSDKLEDIKEVIKAEVQNKIKKMNLDHFPPLTTLENNTENAPTAVQEKITQFREFVNTQCAERDEIMRRKCHLMIFNLKEPGIIE